MEADVAIFFTGQPQRVFDELTGPKIFAPSTTEDGAEIHCQSGAIADKDDVVFIWIARTLEHDPIR